MSPPSRVIPADSIATSVPVPIATPTSAWARAGASFTPSPTITTISPLVCKSLIIFNLSSGITSAKTLSIPTILAIYSAVFLSSPESITTFFFNLCNAFTVSIASGLIGSATKTIPSNAFLFASNTGVLPCFVSCSKD